jgi:hypothetical protein
MLVLRLVVLPERVRSHARELQLGVCAVCGSDGIRYSHVYLPRQACLRGTGGEGDNGGFGVNDGVVKMLGVVSLLYARNADLDTRVEYLIKEESCSIAMCATFGVGVSDVM